MIIVIVPTRGRPGQAADLWSTAHAFDPDVAVEFVVDGDDETADAYHDALDEVTSFIHPAPGCMNVALNIAASAVADEFDVDVIGFMGDDHRPRTPGFGKLVLDAMADGARIVWGDDLVHGPNLPTAVFLHADVVRTLGYFAPPDQRHLFLDNAWKAWADLSGRGRYLPDLVVEHLHPLVGKAPSDAGYERVNAPAVWAHDHDAWQAYCDDGRLAADVEKIAALP